MTEEEQCYITNPNEDCKTGFEKRRYVGNWQYQCCNQGQKQSMFDQFRERVKTSIIGQKVTAISSAVSSAMTGKPATLCQWNPNWLAGDIRCVPPANLAAGQPPPSVDIKQELEGVSVSNMLEKYGKYAGLSAAALAALGAGIVLTRQSKPKPKKRRQKPKQKKFKRYKRKSKPRTGTKAWMTYIRSKRGKKKRYKRR